MSSDDLVLFLILELDLNEAIYFGLTLLPFLVFILKILINKELGRMSNANGGVIRRDVLVKLSSIRVVIKNNRDIKIIIIKIIDSHKPFTQAGINFSL